jgi:hypothetical protein
MNLAAPRPDADVDEETAGGETAGRSDAGRLTIPGRDLDALFGPPPSDCWVCDPCERLSRTLISLREPKCPYCGRKYRDEYVVRLDSAEGKP